MDELDLFLFLGIEGSGRKASVLDIIEGYYSKEKKVSILLHESESFKMDEHDRIEVILYRMSPGKILFPNGIPSNNLIFILGPGRGSCLEFLENVRDWTVSKKIKVSKIITMAHMEKILAHNKVARWYDAAIHFSDIIFLNNREPKKDKEIRKFIERYTQDLSMPCLFEFVKKDRIKNPALAIEGSPRRTSQAFDEQEFDMDLSDVIITDENDENLGDDEAFLSEFQNAAEPYFEKLPNGRRIKEIPDITEFLS